MSRTILISRIIILAAWTLFLGWLASAGQAYLGRLLHPSLWWLVRSATLILILFLAVTLRRQITTSQPAHFWLQWPALLVLLVPLLYFVPARLGNFTSATLNKRAIQTDSGFIAGNINTQSSAENDYPPPLPPKKAPTDIPLTRLTTQANDYLGKEVEVICRAFADKRLPDNHFLCYRYVITCCAADATPIFIVIKYPQAREIQNDQWIHTRGTFSLFSNKDTTWPLITTKKVEPVDEPPFPYIF